MKMNELLGKRIIVKWQPGFGMSPRLIEMKVIEISPSKDYLKILSEFEGFVKGWISTESFTDDYEIIEVLGEAK